MQNQIGDQIVPEAILEQNVMRRFMGQAGQLMLPGADEENRQHRDRHVEPPAPVVGANRTRSVPPITSVRKR